MSQMTGELTCAHCGERVLVVRDVGTGTLVALELARTDGGWYPEADRAVGYIATFSAKGAERRPRDGHHAHTLRCTRTRTVALERMPSVNTQLNALTMSGVPGVVMLPPVTPAGLRALVTGVPS